MGMANQIETALKTLIRFVHAAEQQEQRELARAVINTTVERSGGKSEDWTCVLFRGEQPDDREGRLERALGDLIKAISRGEDVTPFSPEVSRARKVLHE